MNAQRVLISKIPILTQLDWGLLRYFVLSFGLADWMLADSGRSNHR